MSLPVRYNTIHAATTIQTPAKEQEWRIDVGGKWLYKLNTVNENDIEVYFRVNYTNVKEDENKKSKLEKIPVEVYIAKLPGFYEIIGTDFKPNGMPNIEKYFDITKLFENIIWVNIKRLEKSNKQYIIKSIIKSETDNSFECEAYLVFTSSSLKLNKHRFRKYTILKYLKNFLR